MNLSAVNCQQPTSLRFKRWSRKRYAAFISVQRAVTIGQLSANVSERFQTKQTSLHSDANLSENSCRGKEDSIGNQNELVAEEIFSLPLVIVNCLLSTEMQLSNAASDSCNKQDIFFCIFQYTEGTGTTPDAFRFFMPIIKQVYDN